MEELEVLRSAGLVTRQDEVTAVGYRWSLTDAGEQELLVSAEAVNDAVQRVAAEISTKLAAANPLVLSVMSGAIDMLSQYGSEEQQERYLRPMVAGEWTGTMNLTEPQAGSDVGALRTRAEPSGSFA